MNHTQRSARVLIADVHTLIAQAYKSVLEPEFDVVGIVSDGRALLSAAAELKPDVIILEVALPLLNGLDAGEQIKDRIPTIHLVYVSTSAQPETAAEAFRRGASAYLSKAAAVQELVTAIREVRRGVSYLSPLITKSTIQFLLGKDKVVDKHLTCRQREILQLLAEGMSMKEVAYTLNLRPGTIAFHKYRIMNILGAKTNTELMQYAIKQHLIAA